MELKEIIIEAKDCDEATKIAIKKLDMSEDYFLVEELENNKFKAFVNVSLNLNGKRYLESIFKNLGLDVRMEIRNISDNHIVFNIDTDENALIIGKDGKNLNAIQQMLRLYLLQFCKDPVIISLDVAGYTESKTHILEKMAIKTAKEVVRTKTDIKLEPMNSFERRVIHAKLMGFKHVKTESEGFGKDRALVIKYIEK